MATDPLTEPVPAPVAEPAAPAQPPAPQPAAMTPADIMAAFSQMIPMFTQSMMAALQAAAPAAPAEPVADPAPDASAVEPELEGQEEFMDDEFEDDDDDVTLIDEPEPDKNCMDGAAGPMPKGKDRNMSAPAATNVRPSGGNRPAVARNARDGKPDRYAALKAENDELRKRADEADRKIEYLENVGRYQARYSKLQGLESEGYVLDPGQELEDTEDLTDEQFEKHVAKIPDRYQRREPEPASRIQVDRNSRDGAPDRGKPLDAREYGLVAKYSMKWGTDLEETVSRLKKDHPDLWAGTKAG